jgi:hypothetical protein
MGKMQHGNPDRRAVHEPLAPWLNANRVIVASQVAHANVVVAALGHRRHDAKGPFLGHPALALQLFFLKISESMGNHDSNIVDACSVD